MKLILTVLFITFASHPAFSQTAKSRADTKSEIDEAATEVTNQRRVKAKKAAEKKELIKNATSVGETMSSAERTKLKRAIPSLLKKVNANPEDEGLQLQIGKAYLVNGEYENAVTHLKEASKSPNPSTLFLLAEAYRGKEDYLDEIRTLEVITQTDENDAKAEELLGHAYYNTRNFEKSAQHFRKSVSIDKKRRTAYDGMLKLFEAIKKRYESRVVYNDMVKAFGDDAQAYSGLCRLYTEDNLAEDAIASCQKAISIDAKIPDNHVYLGMAYKFTKDTVQAQKILIKAAQQFPNSELALFAAGQLGDEMKNFENAKHYYKRCTKADPGSARCFKRLALISFELKDWQDSLNAFNKACELDRTTLTDARNAASKLRIENVPGWPAKFQTVADKCGLK